MIYGQYLHVISAFKTCARSPSGSKLSFRENDEAANLFYFAPFPNGANHFGRSFEVSEWVMFCLVFGHIQTELCRIRTTRKWTKTEKGFCRLRAFKSPIQAFIILISAPFFSEHLAQMNAIFSFGVWNWPWPPSLEPLIRSSSNLRPPQISFFDPLPLSKGNNNKIAKRVCDRNRKENSWTCHARNFSPSNCSADLDVKKLNLKSELHCFLLSPSLSRVRSN